MSRPAARPPAPNDLEIYRWARVYVPTPPTDCDQVKRRVMNGLTVLALLFG